LRAASARRSSPPQPRGPWVGRDAELSQVCALLERDRLVTIWGGAGVGKTRLALEVVRVLSGLRPEQTPLFCELGEARDSADIVRVVAERAGLPLPVHAEPEYVLGGLLAKLGELLLVLDRCEHLAGELEPLLSLWSSAAPGLRVLSCSRSRLHGTREFELLPLATRAAALPLSAAGSLSEAAELVLARAELALNAPISDQAEAREQAERIAAALDGNPLAIELAAARVPVLGLSGVVARLPAQLALLSDNAAGQTMRGAIAWSWELLREPERLALMQCSVFRGSFTLDAAERVLVCDEPVLELVQALREQSLLMSTPLAGSSALSVRLTMSSALREFASTQLGLALDQHPQLAAVADRHARYYTELASGIERSQQRHEHDNLLAAAEHALGAGDPGAAAVILIALEPALLAAGMNSPRVALLERALAAASGDPRDAARLRVLYARLLAPAGDLTRARAELELVRAQAEQLGDHHLLGVCLLDLGVVLHFGRELEQAARCYTQALEELASVDDPVAEARCNGNLGAVAHDQGRLHDAASGYRHAIALLEDGAEPRLLANFRGNLALIEHELDRPDAARRLYGLAATGLEELCDARLLGIVLGNWGTLELTGDATASALPLLLRAYALLEGCGDRRSFGLATGRLAVVHARQGRLEEAEGCAVRADRLLRRDPLARVLVGCLRGFVQLARAEQAAAAGDLERAETELEVTRARLLAVQSAEHGGRPAREQSDDLRLYSRLLARELEHATAKLESLPQVAG
ncbi:MAG TPA: hypothetical protein VJV78_35850, partial [Polyangiales bacterium]|nr:hypothetical protein [Polyangiales bacterium]